MSLYYCLRNAAVDRIPVVYKLERVSVDPFELKDKRADTHPSTPPASHSAFSDAPTFSRRRVTERSPSR